MTSVCFTSLVINCLKYQEGYKKGKLTKPSILRRYKLSTRRILKMDFMEEVYPLKSIYRLPRKSFIEPIWYYHYPKGGSPSIVELFFLPDRLFLKDKSLLEEVIDLS